MDFNAYLKDVQRTLCSTAMANVPQDLEHGAIGLASEVGELIIGIQKEDIPNILEELGDFLFYNACVYSALDTIMPTDLPDLLLREPFKSGCHTWEAHNVENLLCEAVSTLVDQVKRWRFYGKGDRGILLRSNDMIVRCVRYIAWHYETPISEVLKMNVAKRQARYPEGFTSDKAINRDTENESSAMCAAGQHESHCSLLHIHASPECDC